MTESRTGAMVVPREAAGLGGLAWAYLALSSGVVAPPAPSVPAAVLGKFRDVYNDMRSALVEGLGNLGIEGTDGTLPRTLPVAGAFARADATALAISLLPILELARLNAGGTPVSSYQGETAPDAASSSFGTGEEFLAVFRAAPASEAALRTWFRDQVAPMLPRGGWNGYSRLLWWFPTTIAAAPAAQAADVAERCFLDYVFADSNATTVRSTPGQQAREIVGGGSVPTGTSVAPSASPAVTSAPPEIELDPVVITARATPRPWWHYFVIAFGVASLGGLSWYFWSYRQRQPWRRGRRR